MVRRLFFLWSLAALSACEGSEDLLERVDKYSFQFIGSTLFSQADELTTKELHFDTGRLLGKDVVVVGKVLSWGELGTHLVVKDEYGRLLVVTTHLEEPRKYQQEKGQADIKILGTVERGKKGLPFIFAKSIKVIEHKAKEGG